MLWIASGVLDSWPKKDVVPPAAAMAVPPLHEIEQIPWHIQTVCKLNEADSSGDQDELKASSEFLVGKLSNMASMALGAAIKQACYATLEAAGEPAASIGTSHPMIKMFAQALSQNAPELDRTEVLECCVEELVQPTCQSIALEEDNIGTVDIHLNMSRNQHKTGKSMHKMVIALGASASHVYYAMVLGRVICFFVASLYRAEFCQLLQEKFCSGEYSVSILDGFNPAAASVIYGCSADLEHRNKHAVLCYGINLCHWLNFTSVPWIQEWLYVQIESISPAAGAWSLADCIPNFEAYKAHFLQQSGIAENLANWS